MDLGTIFQAAAAYGVPAIALGSALLGSLYTVGQQHKGLVTRFGKHVRTNDTPGLKLKIPFIESVKKISMQERQEDEALTTKTTDDLFVDLPISIHFQVSDPAVYYFDKENPVQLMKKVVSAAARKYTSSKSFQELYDERQEIKDGVLKTVEQQVSGFGIQINDIVIDEPQASDAVKKTFDRVRSSSLEKDAATNEAAAEYIRKVKSAEADKDRDLLRGEGAAGYRDKLFEQYAKQINNLVSEGTPREEAVQVMMRIMELDTQREVGAHGNTILFAPAGEAGSRIAELQTLATSLDRKPASEQDTAPKRSTEPKEEAESQAPKPAAPGI